MALNHIIVVALLATVLFPTVTAVICWDSANMVKSGQCDGCVILIKDRVQACTSNQHHWEFDKCFDNGSGEKYYACKTDLCNTCCDDVCGPMPNGASGDTPGNAPAGPPAPAPAPVPAGKKSESASSQPMVVVLGLVGVVRLLH